MKSAAVERYERILAADPRSRAFVELARALLEEGDPARAADVCLRGLEHHPGSIQGRVVLGRALLALGRERSAVAAFEAAAAVEPENPYALNLACEALVERGLAGRAPHLFERAAALQPTGERAREWLERSRRESGELSPLPPEEPDAPGSTGGPGAAQASGGQGAGPASADAGSAPGPEAEDGRGAGTAGPACPGAADSAERGEAEAGDAGAASAGAPRGASGEPPASAGDATPPPLRRPPGPPRLRGPRPDAAAAPGAGDPEPSDLLAVLPAVAAPTSSVAAAEPDHEETARIASAYEKEVRSQLLAAEPPAPPVPRRRFLAVTATARAVLAVAGGGITYFAVRRAHRSEDARALVESARRGLLRDTAGSIRDAARALAAARQLDPGAPEPRELAAVAAALLWSDHGDGAGRDLAAGLLAAGDAGDASPVVRALLAAAPAERAEALAVLAGAPASRHVPAEAAAARLLLGRGDDTAALGRLEAAARSTPPSLRALAALGDHALRAGAPEDALRWHLAALAAHATHPGAAAGAGEARLALRRDVPAAIAALRGVEGDPDSAPSASERLRLEIVTARLLAVDGQRAAALERLDRAEEREPSAPDVPMAMAEMLLESGACDRAEPEARRALALAGGGSGRARLLVARAQLCLGRDRELLRGTEGAASREIRLLRAQARLAAGDARGALGELEATGRGGRMAADAAGWYAIALEASGRSGQARATVARLLALARPPVPALLAAAAVARGAGRLDEAERHLRTAVERDALPSPDPEAVEPHCALGRLLVARGRVPEGITELARAAAWNPFHAEAQVALGDARLAVGDAAGARDAFRAAAAAAPAAGPALRGLARAWLAAGDPLEARRAADRAVAADPGSAQSWLVAAQVALAQGDRRAAQRFAEKARRLDGGGAAGAEAKRILARARG